MLTLPDEYNTLFKAFQPYFSKRVWKLVVVLIVGAILAPGKRTVTAVLRIMGLSQERHFQNYHRVLSRAVWSNLALSAVLLQLLIRTFLPVGPVVIGIDETIERRRGAKIKAKGPSRSRPLQQEPFRESQWIALDLLVNIPWSGGCPF